MKSITLQTSDSSISVNEILGRLGFAASSESDGADSVLVAATIEAVAEGSFTQTSNATSLVFSTALSSTASEKLKITSQGHFIPFASGQYDLGSPNYHFRNIYADNIIGDYSGQLDGNLDLNGYDIVGTGNITIDGNVTAEYFYGDLDGVVITECRNDTGSTIAEGTPVYVSGYYSSNGKPLVAPADCANATKMPAIGLLASELSTGSEGHVHVFGLAQNLPSAVTNGFSVGNTVYVDNGGGLTNVRPTGVSELVQNIGRVLKTGTNGRILVLGPGRSNDVPNSGHFEQLTVDGYTALAVDNGNVGIGTATPSNKLHVTDDTRVRNIVIGSGAYGADTNYEGLTHLSFPDQSEDYMIISNGQHTLVSSAGNTYIRASGNDGGHQLLVTPSATYLRSDDNYLSMLNSSTILNEYNNNVDLQVKGENDDNLIYADANNDKVGIGTATPNTDTKMEVSYDPTSGPYGIMVTKDGQETTDGVVLGDCLGLDYQGLSHVTQDPASLEYMIISSGSHTFISASSGYDSIIRAGANSTNYQLRIKPASAEFGSTGDLFKLNSAGAIFNDGGAAVDFRVEGDADQNLLFVQGAGGHDNVAIGTNTPLDNAKFQIQNHGSTAKFYSQVIGGHNKGFGLLNNQSVIENLYSVNAFYSYMSSSTNGAVTNMYHFRVDPPSGVGTITSQRGFYVGDGLQYATNNYGFYGYVPSGTNNYNIYMGSSAKNYFNGDVGIGALSPSEKLDIRYPAGGGMALIKDSDSNDGLLFGDMAYSTSDAYQGIKHVGMTGSSDYMMISEGSHTFMSAKGTGGRVYIRGGGNYGSNQILVYGSSGYTENAAIELDAVAGKEIVVNQQQRNVDFRVESDTDEYLLFTDASAENIGIGTSSPTEKLTLDGSLKLGTKKPDDQPVSQSAGELVILSDANAKRAIACNGDGRKIAATFVPTAGGNQIKISEDGGRTWSLKHTGSTSESFEQKGSMSVDGRVIAFCMSVIKVSIDGGETWNSYDPDSAFGSYYGVTVSRDGRAIVAAHHGGKIWITLDGGSTWSSGGSASKKWNSVTITDDLQTLYAVASDVTSGSDHIYKSTNGGSTWSQISSTADHYFGVDCSSDGTYVLVGRNTNSSNNGVLLVSTNSGSSFTERNTSISGSTVDLNYRNVAVCSDGSRMVASVYGGNFPAKVYYTSDYGTTWEAASTPVNSWWDCDITQDGYKIVASTYQNFAYFNAISHDYSDDIVLDNSSQYLSTKNIGAKNILSENILAGQIISNGNVGIGTASPALAGNDKGLHIHATNYPEIKLTNDTTLSTSDDGSVIQVVNSEFRFTNREDGNSISFYAFDTGGTSRQKLLLSESLILVNGAGVNTDFQVKGENDDYLIYTDANNDKVGIGTASLYGKLNTARTTTNDAGQPRTLDVRSNDYTTTNGQYYTFGEVSTCKKYVDTGVTDTGYIIGKDILCFLSDEGTLNASIGIRTYAGLNDESDDGTLTYAYGIQPRVINNSNVSGSIFDARGVDVYINGDLRGVGNGKISNAYGVHIGNILNATNSYGVYQAGGTNKNYFAGNTGIGTASPSAKLNVELGNVAFNSLNGSYTFKVGSTASDNLLYVDGTSNDKVGIGTASPATKLHIKSYTNSAYGNLFIEDTTSMAAGVGGSIVFGGAYTTAGDLARYGIISAIKENSTSSDSKSAMVFYTNDQVGTFVEERMRITSGGNVGIGTASPSEKLDIYGGNILSSALAGVGGGIGKADDGVHILYPGGGTYGGYSASTVTGYIKIKLPSKNTSTMLAFDLDIYEYEDNAQGRIAKFRIAGYEYNTTNWTRTQVVMDSDGPTDNQYKVIFGVDTNGDKAIWISYYSDGKNGTDQAGSSVWRYPKVSMSNLFCGHVNPPISEWIDGWDVGIVAASDIASTAASHVVSRSLKLYESSYDLASLSINSAFTFPTTDGSAGQSLVTDGAGNVAWSGVSGGSTSLGTLSVTSSQSLFNMTDSYSSGGLAVFLNGVKLVEGTDFSETSSTSFTLTSPAASGDIVEYIAYGSTIASTNLQKTGDTMTGNLTVNADVLIGDGNSLTIGQGGSDSFTLPDADGSANQIIETDGSGNLSWVNKPQVVTNVYTSKTTYSVAAAGSTGTYIAVLNTSITPIKSSSRIRVELNISFEASHHDNIFRLFRSVNGGADTEVIRNDDANYWSGWAIPGYDADNSSTPRTNHHIYIDSPNTTLPVTYKFMIQSAGAPASTFCLNRPVNSVGTAGYENAISQVILTEIPQ